MDALLGRWNSMPASQQPDHLAERMEELFLEASMLEAVRHLSILLVLSLLQSAHSPSSLACLCILAPHVL